ncbi:MAG: hypothetical protein WCR97_01945 [Bacilli bacterium]
MKRFKLLLKISLFKTIKFNVHYFGLKTLFRPLVLIARNVKLLKLKGSFIINNINHHHLSHIGFSTNPQYLGKKMKTVICNLGGGYS